MFKKLFSLVTQDTFRKRAVISGEIELCDESEEGARLIAVASLFGKTTVLVSAKKTPGEHFKKATEVAYSYGPGGNERKGNHVGISFDTAERLEERIKDDEYYDRRRTTLKRRDMMRWCETRYLWAKVTSRKSWFEFEGVYKD
ncbi:hypothetical protein [Cupriavidus sp. D384]|uniref:hypothetical protein n=1 Tax=Cupriavidus sp. D384 TaxID=1538095 RepID=UPI00082C31FD|nr:hypothetical protein [Cupriavidus sp. D384]